MAEFIGRQATFTWGGVEFGEVREKSLSVNGAPIDVTSDDDAGWRKVLEIASENQVSFGLSGVTDKEDFRIAAFSTNARTKEGILTYPSGATVTGDFYLESYDETLSYSDASAFDISIISTGPIVFAPAA